MRLTVLGCYGPYPPAGQSCSGYLLQDGQATVLLDCGNGVLSRLRYFAEPWNVDAVILSHLHSDHVSDMMILRYAIMIRQKESSVAPLAVYAPGEPVSEFERLTYKNYVQANPVTTETSLEFGSMKFTFAAGKHPYPSHLVIVESAGKKLVYSGDTEFFPELPKAVRGADLFLCEANYLREDIEEGHPNHLAAYQAAAVAREAGVRQLVLTHHHPERDPHQALEEAITIFPNTQLARSGSLYQL